ncbi:MAG: NUDIX hydrolase, partial [Beijerinckiaceae bacterium]
VETIMRSPDGEIAFHAVICAFAAHWVAGEPRSSNEIGETVWARPEDVARWPTTRGLPSIVARGRKIVEERP